MAEVWREVTFVVGPQPTVAARVAAGAALLDAHRPGWHRQIDPLTLDVATGDRCVLGQVYGHYSRGVHALGLGVARPRASQLGFDSTPPLNTGGADWMELNTEWRRFLKEREREDAALQTTT